MNKVPFSVALAVFFLPALMFAQQNFTPPLYPAPGNPADAQSQQQQAVEQSSQTPVFRVSVYARSARAVNYRNRGGSTTVDFKGTSLMPAITGRAKVDGKAGRLAIDVGDVGRPQLIKPIQPDTPGQIRMRVLAHTLHLMV